MPKAAIATRVRPGWVTSQRLRVAGAACMLERWVSHVGTCASTASGWTRQLTRRWSLYSRYGKGVMTAATRRMVVVPVEAIVMAQANVRTTSLC